VKPPWTINIYLKDIKARRLRLAFAKVGHQWEGEGHKERENEAILWIYFVFIYENRRMIPVEIVLTSGEGEEGE
jgi:hypothetical protein